jgi:alpha-L-rhamnosidase
MQVVVLSPRLPSFTTGIFGTRFLLGKLSQRGCHDLAFDLANRTKFPSWGHMLENGATTLWETWKQSDQTFSHNHLMLGSIRGLIESNGKVGADRSE